MRQALCSVPGSFGGSVNFPSSGPVSAADLREIKVCETCGRNFLRTAMARTRDCASCFRKAEALRAELAKPLNIPKADAPEEKAQWKKCGRKKGATTVDPRERMSSIYRRAAEALDMKPGAIQ